MIRAALLALAAASPAAAQDWQGVARIAGDIGSADPALAYKGAAAACIAGRGDPEWAVTIFELSGWARTGQAEPGIDTFQSPHPALQARLSNDGALCAVVSEIHDTDEAMASLFHIAVAGFLSVDSAKGAHGCKALALAPGVLAEITASGTDPACASSENSAIRITFGSSR